MKNHFQISCYCFLAIIIAGCLSEHSSKPLKFKAYKNNPVLSPGESGAWDELFVWTPQVLIHDSIFYLFYLGGNIEGKMAVGLATSIDGFHFNKSEANPVLSPDSVGYAAAAVGPGIVIGCDTGWIMYFNAQELATFSPGRCIGIAAATALAGPWKKNENPVIYSGSAGEWDAGFIIPSTVLKLDNGSYMMFYSGGKDIAQFADFYIGMATSSDGINWKKYNDPRTNEHPFAESDPVLVAGKSGEWDAGFVWMANVTKSKEGFSMYYSAAASHSRKEFKAIGYATSVDGIHWKKYKKNPVYHSSMDSFALSGGTIGAIENPSLLYLDSICLMYYECAPFTIESNYISVATAKLPVKEK